MLCHHVYLTIFTHPPTPVFSYLVMAFGRGICIESLPNAVCPGERQRLDINYESMAEALEPERLKNMI